MNRMSDKPLANVSSGWNSFNTVVPKKLSSHCIQCIAHVGEEHLLRTNFLLKSQLGVKSVHVLCNMGHVGVGGEVTRNAHSCCFSLLRFRL